MVIIVIDEQSYIAMKIEMKIDVLKDIEWTS